MITGPANFSVRKAEKANRNEVSRYEAFMYWRNKAIKAIIKSTLPETNLLDEAKKNLAGRLEFQEEGKKINLAYRRYLKNPASLDKSDLTEGQKKIITSFDPSHQWYKTPIAPFEFTNNLANIKRLELRVKELEHKETIKTNEFKIVTIEGGKVIFNYEIDRIQIQHDSKPAYEVISSLKHSGFHWSPSQKAWQRQITNSSIYSASKLVGVTL